MTLCAIPIVGALLCPPVSHSLGAPPPYHWEEPIVWDLCGIDSVSGQMVVIHTSKDEDSYRVHLSRLMHEGINPSEVMCPRRMM